MPPRPRLALPEGHLPQPEAPRDARRLLRRGPARGLTASDLIGVVVVVVVASLARAASAAWRLDAVFPDVAWVILSGAALGLALRAYRGVGGGDFASIRFSDDQRPAAVTIFESF